MLTDTPSSDVLAVADKLSVTYQPDAGQPIRALDQASLEIRPGELLGILGESGSGKSTLAGALLRLLPPDARYDSGSIRLQGRDVLALPEPELRRIPGGGIAFIPQDPAVAPNPV